MDGVGSLSSKGSRNLKKVKIITLFFEPPILSLQVLDWCSALICIKNYSKRGLVLVTIQTSLGPQQYNITAIVTVLNILRREEKIK